MNLPNKLTVLRMILVVAMVIVSVVDRIWGIGGLWCYVPAVMWIMGIIFIIASITDKLDGTIARKTNQVTTFGKFLDPIADKVLVLSAMIIFVEYQKLPSWIPIIVMFREFIVSGFRLVASQKGTVIAASFWGKLKTATTMVALTLAFADNYGYFYFIHRTIHHPGALTLNIVTSVLMTIAIIATIFSGWDYLKKGKEMLKD